MSNDIKKTIAKGVFSLLVITLVAWTSTLTYRFVASALPDMPFYVPAFSLILFDVGMVSWMYVFIHHAEGKAQRSIAIAMTLVDLSGVGLMVVTEILVGGQEFTEIPAQLGAVAVWAIGIWTIVNVAASVGFHLGAPEAQKAMRIQSEKDKVWEEALSQFGNMRAEISSTVASQMGKNMLSDMLDELLIDRNGDGIPDILQGNDKPKEITPRATPQLVAVAAESTPPQPAIVETAVEPEAEAQPEKDVNFTPPQPQK